MLTFWGDIENSYPCSLLPFQSWMKGLPVLSHSFTGLSFQSIQWTLTSVLNFPLSLLCARAPKINMYCYSVLLITLEPLTLLTTPFVLKMLFGLGISLHPEVFLQLLWSVFLHLFCRFFLCPVPASGASSASVLGWAFCQVLPTHISLTTMVSGFSSCWQFPNLDLQPRTLFQAPDLRATRPLDTTSLRYTQLHMSKQNL